MHAPPPPLTKRAFLLCFLMAACLLVGGCATPPAPTCPEGQTPMISESLSFGTATPSGRVSAAEWQDFLDGTVTPRFPDGLSVLRAAGQWRSAAGPIIQEDAYMLTIVHPDDPAAAAALDVIVSTYKERFRQEAVLRLRIPACVSF